MELAVHIKRVPPVVWLWVLLIAAVAAFVVGILKGWHVLTGAGVAIFVVYAYLNERPPATRAHAGMDNRVNPATGLPMMHGTHIDSGGHYFGSKQ